MCSKNSIILAIALCVSTLATEAQVLSLKDCRQFALQQNKKMQANAEQKEAAENMRKAAFSHFLPRISANGAYMWNQKNLHLLGQDYAFGIAGLPIGTAHANGQFEFSPMLEQMYERVPDIFKPFVEKGAEAVGGAVNNEYKKFYDATTIDIQHVLVGQVGFVQPIFMGGKLYNTYRIAKDTKEIVEMKNGLDEKNVLIKVDEAYWRVVSVQQKVKLAKQYHDLLVKLSDDVNLLAEEGLANKGDLLKVKIKLNEAEEKLGQATDGLILSKMALCEAIGMDLYYDIQVDSMGLEEIDLGIETESLQNVAERREEIQVLEKTEDIARAAKALAASGLMPNVVASANYIMTNQSLQDGYRPREYFGFFNAGIVVNVPIAHPDAIYRYKAAKHAHKAAQLKVEEARELITLQATQSQQKVSAAQRKYLRTKTASANAKEALRMAEEGYREGVVSSTELLGAETQWMSAESDQIDAAIDLRMAELNYKKNTGKDIR